MISIKIDKREIDQLLVAFDDLSANRIITQIPQRLI